MLNPPHLILPLFLLFSNLLRRNPSSSPLTNSSSVSPPAPATHSTNGSSPDPAITYLRPSLLAPMTRTHDPHPHPQSTWSWRRSSDWNELALDGATWRQLACLWLGVDSRLRGSDTG
ncbi:hypothetical protein RIF29_39373 [Crotalaria pallida]|uniref:Uncharacterized protein n=1 Tax=Crotalaria pallida TaxID=3830 RepID=A0AAN9E106_CROPI